MADIFHTFPVHAEPKKVFDMFATPEGLNRWWTLSASGDVSLGKTIVLNFGPDFDWRAEVTKMDRDRCIEFKMSKADSDWFDTRVGCELLQQDENTLVKFYHTGWPESNEHFRVSSFCWAMYLRLLRKNVEEGDVIPYERRLDV